MPEIPTQRTRTEPTKKMLRCAIDPSAPFEHITVGGKGFAVVNHRVDRAADGEVSFVPFRGVVQEFTVGGPDCELTRVRSAIDRKVVRWMSREKKRGKILSVREIVTKPDPADADRMIVSERRCVHYSAMAGDEPLKKYLTIEEVTAETPVTVPL